MRGVRKKRVSINVAVEGGAAATVENIAVARAVGVRASMTMAMIKRMVILDGGGRGVKEGTWRDASRISVRWWMVGGE